MLRGILALVLFAGFAGLTAGQDKKDEAKPKADPEGTPLELSVTGKTTKYTLDTGGMPAADYKKMVEDAAKAKGRYHDWRGQKRRPSGRGGAVGRATNHCRGPRRRPGSSPPTRSRW